MSKTIIAPIVGFLIVALKVVFGIEVPEEVGGQIVDFIVTGISLVALVYGIIKNHSKPQEPGQKSFP